MTITRRLPPMVAQTHADSCWAAVLESWSRVDPGMQPTRQAMLVRLLGEGPDGGITPSTKVPVIADTLGLAWGGFGAAGMERHVRRHLPDGHLFCAYSRGRLLHAVLIYRLSDRGNLSFMDPDGGEARWRPLDWFRLRGPYVLMRRADP